MRLKLKLNLNLNLVLLVAWSVLGTADLQPARAYLLNGTSWDAAADGSVTLTYSYSNFLDGGLLDPSGNSVPVSQLRTAVEEALSVWASVAPLNFIEVPDEGGFPTEGNYPAGQFGTIRFGHHPIDGPRSFKAHAFFPPFSSNANCNICGDVHFDDSDRWQLIGTLDEPDILGAAIHELGHSLGLGHSNFSHDFSVDPPDFNGAAMYPTFRREEGPGTGSLHPDDIAGIRAIYGTGFGTVTPLRGVPEPGTLLLLGAATVLLVLRRETLRHRR